MIVRMEDKVIQDLNLYPKPLRVRIFRLIETLMDPDHALEVKRVFATGEFYWMNIEDKYAVFYVVHSEENLVRVLEILTIEQARWICGRYC
jgi:hypothetical protein